MMRFYKTPWFARVLYPSMTWSIPSEDKIYLTFDDGPHPVVTPWVLDQLEKFQAKATFFCIGRNIENHMDLAHEIVNRRHVIGNHTHNHLRGWRTADEDYIKDVEKCKKSISGFSGRKLFRPPYGRVKRSQARKLTNYKLIMWSHLSWDFDQSLDTNRSIRKLKKAKSGSIVVFHDSQKAFQNLQIILPEILKHFHDQGMQFDTIQ